MCGFQSGATSANLHMLQGLWLKTACNGYVLFTEPVGHATGICTLALNPHVHLYMNL